MESFFLVCFYDRKLSSPTRKSCTLPHCLTSGRYGSLDVLPRSTTVDRFFCVFCPCGGTIKSWNSVFFPTMYILQNYYV